MIRASSFVLSSSLVALACALLVVAGTGCDPDVDTPGGAKCSLDAPCAGDDVCQDGTCHAPCTAADSCSNGMCDLGTGLCVQCLSTEDCGGGDRVCNQLTGQCVNSAPGCTGNSECGSLLCDTTKGACVQCLGDGDCGLGARCDLLSSTCAIETTCVNDGDCGGLRCDPAGHTCVECFADAHCGAGTCDTASHSCPTGCVDGDASEPNNADGAIPLGDGGEHEGRICADDIDEFAVEILDPASTLVANVSVDGGALLALRLLNGAGTLVQTASATDDGGLELEATGLTPGFYLLSLGGALDDSEGDYLVHVDVTSPVVCEEIDTEPNDTAGQASALPTNDALRSGSICGEDTDMWSFTAAVGDTLTVNVVAGEGEGALSASLMRGASVVASGLSITAEATVAGTYTIVVTADADVTYTVRALVSEAPPVCMQQDAEPNDTDAQALILAPATVVTGTICAGDTDQHRFAANALDDVHVTVTGANVTARLVRAIDGVQIGSAGTNIVANDVNAGGYRVVVTGTNGTVEGAYTVRVDLTPEPVPDPCEEGGIEPDEGAGDARPLALDGTPLAGRICAADTDFFTFTLPFDSTVTLTARFTHSAGDLDMRLTDAAGVVLQSSTGVVDNEVLARALTPGTYGVRVFGYSGALNTYTMEATLVGCSPEDGFEDNNAVTRPTPVGPNTLNAVRCPGDDDFYAVRLESGDGLNVSLAPTGGAVTMSLVSAAGTLLQSDAAGAGASRTLAASGLPAGRYLVRVTGTGAARVTYALTTAITTNPARCVDDGAAPNETAATAFVLDATGLADGSYAIGSLVTCSVSDPDWFAVDLPAGKQLTAQLSFLPADDVDVEVLEMRGGSTFTRSLARSFATDTQDRVTGVINQGGRYFVRAIGYRSTAVPYGMGIELGSPPAAACLDDRFDTFTATENGGATAAENNDVALDAVQLSPPETFLAQHACPNDGDWHKVTLAAGNVLNVHVAYAHSVNHDIDVRVYGPANQTTPLTTCTTASNTTGTNLTCTSAGVDGTEDLRAAPAAAAGDHFIEVFGYSGGENAYDLTVTIE